MSTDLRSVDQHRHQGIVNYLGRVALHQGERIGGGQLAAAVMSGRKVIATGVNSTKTHPFQQRFGRNKHSISLHAEIDAIKNALRELNVDVLTGCTLWVVRIRRDQPFGLARPCTGCQRCIATFDIKSVIYTTNIGTLAYL